MNARSYFQKLFRILTETQVTDKEGNSTTLDEGFSDAVGMILLGNKKVMIIGNGGSAAIASHIQNDLCKAVGVRAMVFNEPPLLTALSNDHGYNCVFEKPVELWSEPGDLLIAISSSGKSENILRAVQFSRKGGCQILTFSGFQPDNPLRQQGDLNFYVPSETYGLVEAAHLALTHFLTDLAMMTQPKVRDARV